MATIARTEGPRALYNGIVPGLQRQMAFSAIRLGAYEPLKQYLQKRTGVESGPGLLALRIAAGCSTGALAILSAQPTDVVKIRMQAEVLKAGEKPRYSGVINAYSTIAREEGFRRGLYKGTAPNITRTAIINVGEIVVYDAVKDLLVSGHWMKDSVPCHFVAAFAAGFAATLVASPVDVVKTRFMNSQGRYRGAMHCAVDTMRHEGFFAFYKGFNASFTRLVCWNVCLWITYEQLKLAVGRMYKK